MSQKNTDLFLQSMSRTVSWILANKVTVLTAIILVFFLWGASIYFSHQTGSQYVGLNEEIYKIQQAGSESLAKYEDFFRKNPSNQPWFAKLDLLKLYIDKGDFDSAIAQIDKTLDESPEQFKDLLLLSKAQLLWQKGFSDEALNVIEGLVVQKSEPTIAEGYALLLRAQILESQSRFQEALTLYESLVDDENPEVNKQARLKVLHFKMNDERTQATVEEETP